MRKPFALSKNFNLFFIASTLDANIPTWYNCSVPNWDKSTKVEFGKCILFMNEDIKKQNTSGSTLQDPTVINSFFWKAGYKQDIGSRAEQQDNVGIMLGSVRGKEVLLAVLADGMGGMHDGAQFSRIVVDSHLRNFQSALNQYTRASTVLLSLALQANKDANMIYDEDNPGGSTLVSVLFVGDYFYALSVGDSRISLFRKPEQRRGNKNRVVPLQINREHTLGGVLDERAWMGYISFEDAAGNIYRDSLTSSLGGPNIRRIDLTENPVRFLSGDRLVLMSDGIYRSVSEMEMAEELEAPPAEATDKIVQRVLDKKIPEQDNLSIIVIEKQTTNTVIY